MELAELIARRDELAQQREPAHKCAENAAVRRRVFENQSVHLVWQCQICGAQTGGPLSKAAAAAQLQGQEPSPFDDSVGAERLQRIRSWGSELAEIGLQIALIENPEVLEQIQFAATQRAESTTRARAALDTAVPELQRMLWNHRMPFVISHLQREHAAIFEVPEAAAVNRFNSEPELRQWLDAWLHEDFDVYPEVTGRHLARGTGVKIDYIIQPKQHLVDIGFKPGPTGLEVKHLPLVHAFSPKASRFVWQAVSYTDCEFQLNGAAVRLPRVLLFSNLSFSDEERLLRSFDHSPLTNDRAKWLALLELANHAGVGTFEMYGSRERRAGWRIAFAAGVYFRRTGAEYSISNARLFEKERIGSF